MTSVSSVKSQPQRLSKIDAVPLLDLGRQYKQIREEVLAAIERVCASQQFILGAEVEALEREIADYTGAIAAIGCSSGTDAIWLALAAFGVQPGDRVITTAFSFFASASAVVRVGARPVFVDIDPQTLNMNRAQVEAAFQRGTGSGVRALLPVHLYGQPTDMTSLRKIAREFRVPIIEDAAQAIGAEWEGRRAGSLGEAATFSFYPTKNLSAYGEAGMVCTDNLDRASHMRGLRNHGSVLRYHHQELGWNARMDAIQAAVLRVKLKYIDEWNRQRRLRADEYARLFAKVGLLSATDNVVRVPSAAQPAYHVFHQYVIRAQRRDELRQFLTERKIGTEIYYPVPLHLQPCFAYLGYREGDFPEAERAAREVLALPMFPELTGEEQQRVVQSIAEFYS